MVFDEEQAEVIANIDSDMIVLAGAGTGKTTVIGGCIDSLLHRNVKPNEIYCITFTNRAKSELVNRIGNKSVWVGTLHSLAYRVVQDHSDVIAYPDGEITVIGQQEATALVENIAKEMGVNTPYGMYKFLSLVEECAHRFDTWPQACSHVLSKHYAKVNTQQKTWLQAYGSTLVKNFVDYCKTNSVLDFGLISMYARMLVQKQQVQDEFAGVRNLIIDEAQDISREDIDFLLKLFGNAKVAAFGDFNQTIYCWRGSDPSYMKAEIKRRGDAKEFVLLHNYRASEGMRVVSDAYLNSIYGRAVGDNTTGYRLPVITQGNITKIKQLLKEHEGEDVVVIARNNNDLQSLKMCVNDDFQGAIKIGTANELDGASGWVMRLYANLLNLYITRTNDFAASEMLLHHDIRIQNKMVRSSDMFGDLCAEYVNLVAAINAKNLCVLDFETTSTRISEARIVEVAAYKAVTREKFLRFVRPGVPVGASFNVHGLSDEFLDGSGEDKHEVLLDLSKFLDGCVVVGHNIWYDLSVMYEEMARVGVTPPKILTVIDTLREARRYLPDLQDYRLETVRRAVGARGAATHDAMDDVIATSNVLAIMIRDYIRPLGVSVAKEANETQAAYSYLVEGINDCFKLMDKKDFVGALKLLSKIVRNNYDISAGIQFVQDTPLDSLSSRGCAEELHYALTLSKSELDRLLKKQGKIPALTVHQSKGCEFDTVILWDWQDQQFGRGFRDEEEFRLFYVGLTRARKNCIIVSPASDQWEVSDRISMLPKDCVEFC